MQLTDYITLGRSGLRISPLCLGTLTFGTESGWGMDKKQASQFFDHYRGLGGNFIDTANNYARGASETILGELLHESGSRDEMVIATKFTRSIREGDPNAAGNGRKTITQSLEQSLRRLKTEYIDIYWMHNWDGITPVEEVIDSADNLIREGKIRYFGLSDVPAWYAARAQSIAEFGGHPRIIALQLEYSLIERSIEREHLPAMQELGLGLCAWSPLGFGFLSGKYQRESGIGKATGRMSMLSPEYKKDTERNWDILDEVQAIAETLGRPPAQIALNWIAHQPGCTAPIVGARNVDQLKENLGAIDFTIPDELMARLDAVSAPEPAHPYYIFTPPVSDMLNGGVSMRAWRPAKVRQSRY